MRRSIHTLLAFASAFVLAGSADADSIDNGLATGDPAFFGFDWDEGGSSFVFFDGLNQVIRYEPYVAYDDGSGLRVQSISSLGPSSFATTAGPAFTPRSASSNSSVSETRSDGEATVDLTGAVGDGADRAKLGVLLTNSHTTGFSSVSITLYLDGDIGFSFNDDRGDTTGSTSSPFTDLVLRIFDAAGSAIGLSFDGASGAPSSFEIGDASALLIKVEAGDPLSNTVSGGPDDLAAALRWELGALAIGEFAGIEGEVIANPVPEPGTALLVFLGLAGLGIRRRGELQHA